MAEKKIRIGADTSGLESGFEKAGRSIGNSLGGASEAAENLGRELGESIDGATSKMSELDMATTDLFNNMLKDSKEYSKNFRERAKFIMDEIRLIGLASKEEEKRAKLQAKLRYDEAKQKFSGGTSGDKKNLAEAKEKYLDEMQDIQSRSEMADLQESMLKNKLARHQVGEGSVSEISGEGGGFGRLSEVADKPREVFNAAASAAGFGAILSITGFVGKLFGEGGELDQAVNNASAMGVRATGGIQGMKTADVLRYNIQTAKELGFGGVAGAQEAQRQGRMEQALGMDLGSLSGFNAVLRNEEQGKTLSDSLKEMVSIMQKSGLFGIDKGDFTMMHELMERQNQLNNLQANSLEQINTTSSTQVIAAFAKAGGSFADQRAGGTISQINRSITDPDNDFKKAFVMRSIKKRMPGSSLLDIKEMQERGVFGEGVIHGIMTDIMKMGGGDEQQIWNIKSLFGGSVQQSKAMFELFKKDPEALKKIGSIEELSVDEKTERRLTTGGVGRLEQAQATFNDMFAKAGKGVIDAVVPHVQRYLGAFDKEGMHGVLTEFGSDMKFIFKEGAEMMREAVWGEGASLKKGLTGNQTERKAFAAAMKTSPINAPLGHLLELFNTGKDEDKKVTKETKDTMKETNEHLRAIVENTKLKSQLKVTKNKNYSTK